MQLALNNLVIENPGLGWAGGLLSKTHGFSWGFLIGFCPKYGKLEAQFLHFQHKFEFKKSNLT